MSTELGRFPQVFDAPGELLGSIVHAEPWGDVDRSSCIGSEGEAESERASDCPPSDPGLVEQETTHTFSGRTTTQALKTLGKERRVKRMRRCVIAHADATREELQRGGHRCYAALVTLTYRDVGGYQAEHVTGYLDRLRNWCGRRGVKVHYEWVMELQQRGAPHYHALLWLPEGFKVPKPDAQGWWEHGMSNIKRATRAVGYLVKYVSKGNNQCFTMPVGARLFGTGGSRAARLARHRAGLPRWLVGEIPVGCRAVRDGRGGWVAVETGEVFKSPYAMRWGYDDKGDAFVTVVRRVPGEAAWQTVVKPFAAVGGSEAPGPSRLTEEEADAYFYGISRRVKEPPTEEEIDRWWYDR